MTRIIIGLSPVWLGAGFIAMNGADAGDPAFAGPAFTGMAAVAGEPVVATPVVEHGHAAQASTMLSGAGEAGTPDSRQAETRLAQASLAGEASVSQRAWTGARFEGAVSQPEWDEEAGVATLGGVPVPLPPRRPSSNEAAPSLVYDEMARNQPISVPEKLSQPADLSVLGDARVVIHRPRGGTPVDAGSLLDRLQARAVGDAEVRTVGVEVPRPDIRYFHRRDRPAAEEVARMLGQEGYTAVVKDFTHYSPAPSLGTVEVWLPG